MNRNIFIAVMLLSSLVTFDKSRAGWDSTNFSAEGRKWQPAPTGYGAPGKDNGRGVGAHNTGEDCGICHRPGGKASNSVFTMSGTLYIDRAGRKPLKGGEVILQDINGKVISMTSNEVGNFWTYESIGGNPLTEVGHGAGYKMYSTDAQGNVVTYADTTYPQTWQYKTWVKNGDQELPMVTIAPVGGATIINGVPDINSRMSCSMHHKPTGGFGALYVSTKSTLSSYPASGLRFKKHILPIFRNQCAPCHVPNSTTTRIVTKTDLDTPGTVVDYSGNIDLTSYGAADGTNGTKKGVVSIVNTSTPDQSKLFTATVKGSQHSGGWFWSSADADYKAIRQWIAEGAQDN